MKTSHILRIVGIIGVIILLFIVFFYVLPIYHFKNADTHIKALTGAVAKGDKEQLREELDKRNRMKLVSDEQVQNFIGFVEANKNKKVKGELISSDNIIISVLNDSCEARLVLGQHGILSKWQVVNIRYVEK
jgi:uncharacterized membrane protein YvbJ